MTPSNEGGIVELGGKILVEVLLSPNCSGTPLSAKTFRTGLGKEAYSITTLPRFC